VTCPTPSSRWRSPRRGQKARLAARLYRLRVEIKSETEFASERPRSSKRAKASKDAAWRAFDTGAVPTPAGPVPLLRHAFAPGADFFFFVFLVFCPLRDQSVAVPRTISETEVAILETPDADGGQSPRSSTAPPANSSRAVEEDMAEAVVAEIVEEAAGPRPLEGEPIAEEVSSLVAKKRVHEIAKGRSQQKNNEFSLAESGWNRCQAGLLPTLMGAALKAVEAAKATAAKSRTPTRNRQPPKRHDKRWRDLPAKQPAASQRRKPAPDPVAKPAATAKASSATTTRRRRCPPVAAVRGAAKKRRCP